MIPSAIGLELIVATVLVFVVLVGHAILVNHLVLTLEHIGRDLVAQLDQIQTILAGTADDLSTIAGYTGDVANQGATLVTDAAALLLSLKANGATPADIAAATALKASADALATSAANADAALDKAVASISTLANPPASTLPVVSSISPTSGPIAGGTPVAILGEGFTGATGVFFGAVAAASFVPPTTDTAISAVSPPSAAGTVDVTVVGPGGTSVASPADQYTSS